MQGFAGLRGHAYGQTGAADSRHKVNSASLRRRKHIGGMRTMLHAALRTAPARTGAESKYLVKSVLSKRAGTCKRRRRSCRHIGRPEHDGTAITGNNIGSLAPRRREWRTRAIPAVAWTTVAAFHYSPCRDFYVGSVNQPRHSAAFIAKYLKIFVHRI